MVEVAGGRGSFVEVYVNCSLEVCEERDRKGLYKKARLGQISNFTGISDPYEHPEAPEVVLDTAKESAEESAQKVIETLGMLGLIRKVL